MLSAPSVESSGTPDGATARPAGDRTLRRSSEFRAVVDEGRRLSGRRMVLHVRVGDQGVRVGLVIGRGVGGAVRRNRVRRRLREAWREVSPLLRGGVDVVVVARPNAAKAKTDELRGEMEALLVSGGVARR